MTVVTIEWNGWDMTFAHDGDQFTCPACHRNGRLLQSFVHDGLRFIACQRCWKNVLRNL